MGILGSGEIRTGWGAADVIVGAAGLVLSLGAFAGIHWVRRRFVLPLERVAAAIGRMRDGGTGTRIEGEGLLPVEREFNEMARRIDGKLFELKRVDDLKTEFISTVSHELRTPLTSIAGYTQLLSQGDAGPVNETQREFLEIVDTNVRRLSELINDLLDIEKIQAGKIHLARERVDLGGVLAECVDTFRLLASRKGLALELRVAAREPFVIGDRARLVQIFMNLLSNAVKYTDRGRIEVVAEERDFALSVEIRDSGIGISAEEREGLFEKFYRTKSAALSRQGGTGLGLAVTRALVEGHQGKIRVESEPGKGSVFAVRLPFAGAITAPANGSAAERGRQVPALSIWIIDSDEADAAAMSLWLGSDPELREEGRLEIRRFRTVNEVAELAASGTPPGPPAAVVVEAGETGNGAPAIGELSELLRSDLRITAPLLAIGESLDAGMAFAHGARASLSKPLEEQRFLGALRGLLEGRRRRVLIVDADADLRLLIKRSLERRGFRADDLDRGEEALRRLRQESYDLLLLDLGLPDVSGEDFLRALHRLPSLERLPVFVMLGQDKAPPSRARLLSIGADQFVGKHGGIGGIVDAVHDFLETPLEAE